MVRRRLSDAERAAVLEAYLAGEKIDVIAARFGVLPTYPSTLARRRGHPVRRNASRLSADERQGILAAYAAGEKLEVISALFGIGSRYPSTIARQAGLPLRVPGRVRERVAR